MNKKLAILLVGLIFSTSILFSQNNVGIGTISPDNNAALDIVSDSKGILIPRLTTVQRLVMNVSLSETQKGLLVFDGDLEGFFFWNGSDWQAIEGSGGSATCFTLQEAYDCGSAGSGRIINANSGAVEINLDNIVTNTEALIATADAGTYANPSSAIVGQNSAYGSAIYSENTNTANPYNTVNASTNSANENTSAIAGYYDGSSAGVGVFGSVYFDNPGGGKAGVFGVNNRTSGGYGVLGQGFNGVVGLTNYGTGFGVYGGNTNAIGTDNGAGVLGDGNYGVWGQTSFGFSGVFGLNSRTDGGIGVEGEGFNGVAGITVQGLGFGVYGENASAGTVDNNVGVAGLGWVGVFGEPNDATGYGVYSNGDFGSSGTKSFMIDHPQDPENKFLKHFCMESPEVINFYRGTVRLDQNGNATIIMPDYFLSINVNFSYHLTPLGSPAPGLFVSKELSENSFEISGGTPGGKVSWSVYAQRNDPYLRMNPESSKVEVEKRENQKGKYLIPELYSQPDSKKLIQMGGVKTPAKKLIVVPKEEKNNQENFKKQ